jgi:hypothetical protein
MVCPRIIPGANDDIVEVYKLIIFINGCLRTLIVIISSAIVFD